MSVNLKIPGYAHEIHRTPDKSVYWKIVFFISSPKHMLWVLEEPSQ